jgi:hypothetical protein
MQKLGISHILSLMGFIFHKFCAKRKGVYAEPDPCALPYWVLLAKANLGSPA